MSQILETESHNSDDIVDQMLLECDKTLMSIPDTEYEPHLLISKVNVYYILFSGPNNCFSFY